MIYLLKSFLFLSVLFAAPKQVTSVTVSQIGTQVLTSREVHISFLIDQWELYTAKGTEGLSETKAANKAKAKAKIEKLGELPILGSEQFKKQLALVQLEQLVILEAENFAVGEVTSEEVRKKAAFIQESLKEWPDWKRLEVSLIEIESIVSRKLRAKNFIQYKSESMGIQITETEMKEYYDQNRIKFGSLSYEKMRENIREYLSQQNVEVKMKDWISILKKKYQVRNLQYEEAK